MLRAADSGLACLPPEEACDPMCRHMRQVLQQQREWCLAQLRASRPFERQAIDMLKARKKAEAELAEADAACVAAKAALATAQATRIEKAQGLARVRREIDALRQALPGTEGFQESPWEQPPQPAAASSSPVSRTRRATRASMDCSIWYVRSMRTESVARR